MDLVIKNDRKKREVFLFNDMLIVAKGDGDKLKCEHQVSFDMILVNSPPDEPGRENIIEIVHIGSSKFVLSCDLAYTKDTFIKALTEATHQYVAQGKQTGATPSTVPPSTDVSVRSSIAEPESPIASSPDAGVPPPLASIDVIAEAAAKTMSQMEEQESAPSSFVGVSKLEEIEAAERDVVIVKEDVAGEEAPFLRSEEPRGGLMGSRGLDNRLSRSTDMLSSTRELGASSLGGIGRSIDNLRGGIGSSQVTD
ncbi:hypothetical protein HK104_000900, partial [Borealophlyctis nickersoniae]